MTKLRMAGRVLASAVLLMVLAACGTLPSQPRAAQTAASPGQAASVRSCLDTPRQEPIPPGDPATQVKAISARVETLRDHRFGKALAPEFVTAQEISRRIAGKVNAEYPADEADADRRILAALGTIPADVDLRALVAKLLGGQVIGFYDTKTKELVVAARDPNAPLGPAAQVTVAHELDHALVDATIGLPEEQPRGPSDAGLAALALVEGDAVLTQQRFLLSSVPPGQQLGLATDPETAQAMAEFQGFPFFLRAQLEFPYSEGSAFVCSLYAQGGWAAVDAAYRARPTTTAQILFPQRYAAHEGAVDPRDPGTLAHGWKRARTDTVGAADLLWLFEAPGDDPQASIDNPLSAAEAWAGGEVHLWTNGATSAVGVALVDRTGNGTLCGAVARWYRAAFPHDRAAEQRPGETLANDGPAQDAVLRCDGRDVRLGIGPDLATARTLAS
jgi:hypothetical protein